jgi:SNF family Na+-dependent transporter
MLVKFLLGIYIFRYYLLSSYTMGTNKTIYGLLAFGPIGLILLSFVAIFVGMAGMDMGRGGYMPDSATIMIFGFVGLIMIASLLSIVSMIMYILHISKNKLVPEDQRIFWIVGIVMFNGITNIVYFFMYITKEDELMAAQQRQQQPKSPWE